ncbi:amylo-alpha-1,6-glucosidase [Sphingobacterium thalpophilum]|uniref:Amylo-alpha-1,6-glucosidase n=1 Tax=Sphingobacterium thalpophilum TaxID=259 RepID=A0ABV4HAF8_9SPHI
MRNLFFALASSCIFLSCNNGGSKTAGNTVTESIRQDSSFQLVKDMASNVIKSGFNAGDGYGEVWIRDYNTFINLAVQVHPHEQLKEQLAIFFKLQGEDGNIADGFVKKSTLKNGTSDYYTITSTLAPEYAGHKNTVETDQETSLIQAVHKYVTATKDSSFLTHKIGRTTVKDRMEKALQFLMDKRYNSTYGLLWGATTVDWGDVQPEHDWGVHLDENSHIALDIYDNAMFLIALDNYMELVPEKKEKWVSMRETIASNTMKHLWDDKNQKFIPHIYIAGSPFPKDFDENKIYYHGGTAVAIEANLLSKAQIKTFLDKMIKNVKDAGAATIGLTIYPTYPAGFFKNKGMYPYGYQNGGDWTWFGGRMIQQLVKNGFQREAYEQIKPMLARVIKNKGFYEWYTKDNQPEGSGTFRGEAGVLYDAIILLENTTE